MTMKRKLYDLLFTTVSPSLAAIILFAFVLGMVWMLNSASSYSQNATVTPSNVLVFETCPPPIVTVEGVECDRWHITYPTDVVCREVWDLAVANSATLATGAAIFGKAANPKAYQLGTLTFWCDTKKASIAIPALMPTP